LQTALVGIVSLGDLAVSTGEQARAEEVLKHVAIQHSIRLHVNVGHKIEDETRSHTIKMAGACARRGQTPTLQEG